MVVKKHVGGWTSLALVICWTLQISRLSPLCFSGYHPRRVQAVPVLPVSIWTVLYDHCHFMPNPLQQHQHFGPRPSFVFQQLIKDEALVSAYVFVCSLYFLLLFIYLLPMCVYIYIVQNNLHKETITNNHF